MTTAAFYAEVAPSNSSRRLARFAGLGLCPLLLVLSAVAVWDFSVTAGDGVSGSAYEHFLSVLPVILTFLSLSAAMTVSAWFAAK